MSADRDADDRPRHGTRRRVLLVVAAGSGFAFGGAVAQGLRRALAAAPAPVAADDRPALHGRAPSIFVGHGSPMNAIEDNRFTRTLQRWGYQIGLPRAIVVVSAHWLTPRSTRVSAASAPETIHDFGGFPAELNAMTYPAPGAHRLERGGRRSGAGALGRRGKTRAAAAPAGPHSIRHASSNDSRGLRANSLFGSPWPRLQMKLVRIVVPAQKAASSLALSKPLIGPQSRSSARAAMMK